MQEKAEPLRLEAADVPRPQRRSALQAPALRLRPNHRNHLASVPSINVEIAVERQHTTWLVELRHANQAGIRQ
jgi:hypothetical protein